MIAEKTEQEYEQELTKLLLNYHPGEAVLAEIRQKHPSARAQVGILRLMQANEIQMETGGNRSNLH